MALLVATLTTWIHVRGRGWIRELPTRSFATILPWLPEGVALDGIRDRAAHDSLSRRDAAALLDGLLQIVEGRGIPPEEDEISTLDELAAAATSTQATSDRVARIMGRLLGSTASPAASGLEVALFLQDLPSDVRRPVLFVRVREVRVNDAPVRFQVDGNEENTRWRSINDELVSVSMPEAPQTIEGRPSQVDIDVEVAHCPGVALNSALQFASTFGPSPAEWPVPVGIALRRVDGSSAAGGAFLQPTRVITGTRARFAWLDQWAFVWAGAAGRLPHPVEAAVHLAAITALGVAAGALTVAATLVARAACRRRPRLVEPSCAHCGAFLRGSSSPVPESCAECGASTSTLGAVRYTLATTHRIPSLLATSMLIGVVGLLILTLAPRLFAHVRGATLSLVLTPEAYGRWYAHRLLTREPAAGADTPSEWASGRMPTPPFMSNRDRDIAARAGGELLLAWRMSHDDGISTLPQHLRTSRLALLSTILARLSNSSAVDAQAAQEQIRLFASAGRMPDLEFPLVVRAGSFYRVIEHSPHRGPKVLIRYFGSAQEPSKWFPPEGILFKAPTEPGAFELALEWTLLFGEETERNQPLHGVTTRTITALPDTDFELPVTQPGHDPFVAGAATELIVRPIGDSTEMILKTRTSNLGMRLRGEWIVALPEGPVTLRYITSSSEATGVLPGRTSLPDRVELRFQPKPSYPSGEVNDETGPDIFWAHPSSLTFCVSSWQAHDVDHFIGATRYIVEPTCAENP